MTRHPNHHPKVVQISSYRPRETAAASQVIEVSSRPDRRGIAILAAGGLAVTALLGGLMYKGNESFKHDQRMEALTSVEKAKSETGEERYLVVHAGATLRRTPTIPGRTSSPNHPEAQKDNAEPGIPEGQALFMLGTLTHEDETGVVWYGAELVEDIDNIDHQSRDDLGDHIVWVSSELFDQKRPDGSPYLESQGSGESVKAHLEGGHFLVDGRPFAVAQQVDVQTAQQTLARFSNAE